MMLKCAARYQNAGLTVMTYVDLSGLTFDVVTELKQEIKVEIHIQMR